MLLSVIGIYSYSQIPKSIKKVDFDVLFESPVGSYSLITSEHWYEVRNLKIENFCAENHTWGDMDSTQWYWILDEGDRNYPEKTYIETYEFMKEGKSILKKTIKIKSGYVLIFKKGPWSYGYDTGNGWSVDCAVK